MKSKRPTLAQLQAQFKAGMPHDQDPSKIPAWMNKKPRDARKPGVKNKSEEHDDQAAVVSYLRKLCPDVLVSASLNGELRPMGDMGKFYGWVSKLKTRGMLTGDCDLRLTWAPARCIFIEMKKRSGGVVSEAQNTVGDKLRAQGFKVYTLSTGIDGLKDIIKTEDIPCRETLYEAMPLPF